MKSIIHTAYTSDKEAVEFVKYLGEQFGCRTRILTWRERAGRNAISWFSSACSNQRTDNHTRFVITGIGHSGRECIPVVFGNTLYRIKIDGLSQDQLIMLAYMAEWHIQARSSQIPFPGESGEVHPQLAKQVRAAIAGRRVRCQWERTEKLKSWGIYQTSVPIPRRWRHVLHAAIYV